MKLRWWWQLFRKGETPNEQVVKPWVRPPEKKQEIKEDADDLVMPLDDDVDRYDRYDSYDTYDDDHNDGFDDNFDDGFDDF